MSRTRFFSLLKKSLLKAKHATQNEWQTNEWSERFEEATWNRREFLKTSGLLALAPIAAHADGLRVPTSKQAHLEPILIIGAGAAGLAAAYTLKKSGIPSLILEASHRIGGRILTQKNFNISGQFIELGAELVDSQNLTLIALATELGLEIEEFHSDKNETFDNLFDDRGVLRTEAQLVEGLKNLVGRILKLHAKFGDLNITYKSAGNLAAVRYDKMTLREFLDAQKDSTEPWVLKAIETAFVGEYGRDAEEQAALNLITLIGTDLKKFSLFGPSDESKRIKGGNQRLIDRLFEIICQNKSKEEVIRFGAKVVSMSDHGSKIQVAFEVNGQRKNISASRVITTVPFPVMAEWEGLGKLGLSPRKLNCIQRLGYGQNSKIMMDFNSRFWRLKIEKKSTWESIITDRASQAFWETSRLQKGSNGIITNFLGGSAGQKADRSTIETALKDLSEIDSRARSVFVKGVVQNWNQIPTAKGSYACARPGQWTSLWGAAGEVELKGRLHFAGEHASLDWAGFMEGAFQTGVQVAQAIANQLGRKIKKGA